MILRAPAEADAPAVLAVVVARDVADLGVPDCTLEDILEEWRAESFDAAADARLCETDTGEVVGYAVARRPGSVVAVSPDREGLGAGTALLDWLEGRERAHGWEHHRQAIGERNARAAGLLRSRGYGKVRSYHRMTVALAPGRQAPEPPAGVTLRELRPAADEAVLYELDAAAFAGAADYSPETLLEFRERHVRAHDLDPALSRVAERDLRPVGFLLARRWEQDSAGYVAILAVHPREQGRGLGSALLGDAFAAFAAAGLSEGRLGVASDNPRALGLYERQGMKPQFSFDVWERPISAA